MIRVLLALLDFESDRIQKSWSDCWILEKKRERIDRSSSEEKEEEKHQEEGEFDEEEGQKLAATSVCALSGQLIAQLVHWSTIGLKMVDPAPPTGLSS